MIFACGPGQHPRGSAECFQGEVHFGYARMGHDGEYTVTVCGYEISKTDKGYALEQEKYIREHNTRRVLEMLRRGQKSPATTSPVQYFEPPSSCAGS